MSILIDTQVFLWAAGMGDRLSDSAKTLLSESGQPIFFSAASAWEIAIKWSKGRLTLPAAPFEFVNTVISAAGISQLPVTLRDASAVAELPFHHQDPFDRLLVAQARLHGLRLMTAHEILEKYDVDVIGLWLDDDDE
ncbi:MAG: type II toxin-antitoxin system VapC family toxin [Pyrinomonadaceae bacterium]